MVVVKQSCGGDTFAWRMPGITCRHKKSMPRLSCRRNTDDKLVPGRCKRPHKGTAVQLLNAPSEVEETKRIAKQLLQWQREGYAWNDMAVLCRAKLPVGCNRPWQ